jgi:hypothetical protein
MMPPDRLETLHQVNDSLRSALIDLRPEQRHCSTITPEHFSDLLSEILRAAECLRRTPAQSETAAALTQESLEYHTNLERLRDLLPELHGNLLAEKSRLETAQTHIAAAAAWAQGSSRTF